MELAISKGSNSVGRCLARLLGRVLHIRAVKGTLDMLLLRLGYSSLNFIEVGLRTRLGVARHTGHGVACKLGSLFCYACSMSAFWSPLRRLI